MSGAAEALEREYAAKPTMRNIFQFLFGLWILHRCSAQFGDAKQTHGFVEFRKGCHLFYWMFYAMEMGEQYTERPLVIWLQGGPGSSSTGHGNFVSVGPLDIDLKKRETTWARKYNVLFIDCPVGAGYSYFEHTNCLVDSNMDVAQDLVIFMEVFYKRHPEFVNVPLYITGQAYGAKMAVDFALLLHEKIQNKILKGIALGNPWISPIDLLQGWAPLLEALGFVDQEGNVAISEEVLITKSIFDRADYVGAVTKIGEVQKLIIRKTHNIDFYNVTSRVGRSYKFKDLDDKENPNAEEEKEFSGFQSKAVQEKLDHIMNHLVRRALNITTKALWGSQSNQVSDALVFDFLRPVTRSVELLLNTTNIEVVVYNGHLDLLCTIQGQQFWVDKLVWNGADLFKAAPRQPIWIQNKLRGYVKGYRDFKFYSVIGSGHYISIDNPEIEAIVLKDLTGIEDDEY